MALDKILSIGGKPGLYKLLTQTRTGFVGESLLDGKRVTVGMRSNVSVLSEIAIYTLEEEVPLREVFQKIKEKEGGKKTGISHKAEKIELEEFALIISDIKMPGFDGQWLYEQVKKDDIFKAKNIIFTTGDVISEKTQEFLANIDNFIISKPFDVESFNKIIEKIAS